ncbi:MAG: hypothetical protein FJ122_14295, partial [Deltaproteobacteria bacterium]|nr:hypothetical protein [Deltaproteobacteria bacterium]
MGSPRIDDRVHRRRMLFIDDPGARRAGAGIFSCVPSRVSHPGEPACGKISDAGPEEQIRPCLSGCPSQGRSLRSDHQESHGMRYVIVGSGPAGISAAEEIRKSDPEGMIAMITADPHPACSPVMLTYWMSGHTPEERLFFRETGSWAAEHRVDLHCGKRVTAIDVQRRCVALLPEEEIAYDRLLIAAGAVPLIPPIPGIGAKGVCTFRTFADAEEILTSRQGLEQICIMGGGFIGIKLACHLRERGLSVLVVEKEPRLASRIFDQRASDIVKAQL